MANPRNRKPWPMKWVMIPTIGFIIIYTFLTLHYRRPGPAYQPYEEAKTRATTGKLLEAGFQRVSLSTRRPLPTSKTPLGAPIATTAAVGGVPPALKTLLIDQPALAATIDRISAPISAAESDGITIEITCTLPDNRQQVTGASLYRKGTQIMVVPTINKLESGLLARTREQTIDLDVPPGALKPGRYAITVIGSQESRGWTLQVN